MRRMAVPIWLRQHRPRGTHQARVRRQQRRMLLEADQQRLAAASAGLSEDLQVAAQEEQDKKVGGGGLHTVGMYVSIPRALGQRPPSTPITPMMSAAISGMAPCWHERKRLMAGLGWNGHQCGAIARGPCQPARCCHRRWLLPCCHWKLPAPRWRV